MGTANDFIWLSLWRALGAGLLWFLVGVHVQWRALRKDGRKLDRPAIKDAWRPALIQVGPLVVGTWRLGRAAKLRDVQ
jgi:hypothetical protein